MHAQGSSIDAPQPQDARIVGSVMDSDGAVIPGATVSVYQDDSEHHNSVITDKNGGFALPDVWSAVSLHVLITSAGFAAWTSPELKATPGQLIDLGSLTLQVSTVETSVTAVTPEELAVEQVNAELNQRVFGIFPDFYVSYSKQPMPLSAKLKFKLALHSSMDTVNIVASAAYAGLEQVGNTPDYRQGVTGYGQRFGAAYASGASDVMIGGAILPALLHQDPRFFYQGTGSTKSRLMHAVSAPFIAHGDNGQLQVNYSSLGGDLIASALTNTYYPTSNRGPGIVLGNAALLTGGRIANAIAQEFILRRFVKNATQTN